MAELVTILLLFFVAALFEIGGGYLVWLWIKEKKGWVLGISGGVIIFIYGVILTFQPSHFGRVYAAYGGIFVVSSIIWGGIIDKKTPDKHEIIGAAITLVGALIIFFAPR